LPVLLKTFLFGLQKALRAASSIPAGEQAAQGIFLIIAVKTRILPDFFLDIYSLMWYKDSEERCFQKVRFLWPKPSKKVQPPTGIAH